MRNNQYYWDVLIIIPCRPPPSPLELEKQSCLNLFTGNFNSFSYCERFQANIFQNQRSISRDYQWGSSSHPPDRQLIQRYPHFGRVDHLSKVLLIMLCLQEYFLVKSFGYRLFHGFYLQYDIKNRHKQLSSKVIFILSHCLFLYKTTYIPYYHILLLLYRDGHQSTSVLPAI